MTTSANQAVILGSSRGFRRLNATKSVPISLRSLESSGTVLDWALHSLSVHGVGHVTYIGGYQIQKVIERYPNLSYRYHADWQHEGELASLITFEPNQQEDCYFLRSSTVLLPAALDLISQGSGQLRIGYYTVGRNTEFLGVVFLASSVLEQALTVAKRTVENNLSATMSDWIDALESSGIHPSRVNLDGSAAPISDQVTLAQTLFSSKAQTLARVQPLITRAVVLNQISFDVAQWKSDPEATLRSVQDSFGNGQVIVRSSTRSEDGLYESLAGRFLSVLDVSAANKAQLKKSIDEVVQSYASRGRDIRPGDEVFVQPQVSNLVSSGVILTRDPETGAPYFVLNLDRLSGRSDQVTSGSEAAFDTVYVSRYAGEVPLAKDVKISLQIARELEQLMHLDTLDIELGIDQAGEAYLFQVRPIPPSTRKFQLADEDLEEELRSIGGFLKGHMRPHSQLYGSTTMFSTMTDWNPAEMIGTTPRPLALSLYQVLIGNRSWSEARALIGYHDVRPMPLIVALGGRPYVDIRSSLNSFLPCGIDPRTAKSWVDHGLSLLLQDSRLHDKVEFEVAAPCLTLDFTRARERMVDAGLDADQINRFREQLLALTDRIITGESAPISQQVELLQNLERRRQQVLASSETNATALAGQISYLLNDCERYGLVPFSVLARYAFIAMDWLNSLRSSGVFDQDDYHSILQSIPTVASQLSQDMARLSAGELLIESFLADYGHLRPSSYDITSPNYAQGVDIYLKRKGSAAPEVTCHQFEGALEIFDKRKETIAQLLAEQGFKTSYQQLRDFIVQAIPAREWAKFEFMKTINSVLELIATFGEQLGFNRDEISYLQIDRIIRRAADSPTGADLTQLRREIDFAKKRWNLTCAIRLPHVVRSTEDISAFQMEEWTPNFVSIQRVVAPPVILEGLRPDITIDGHIVLIRAADPGYDWIFNHRVSGLITQFGGVASHMAIRAAEFGLPAAIGCGELIFERLRSAELIELDCMNRKVTPVR